MDMEQLLKELDMESVSDMEYSESFCNLMEAEIDIPEDLFFVLLGELSPEQISEMMREYLREIISGIADDCIDFYAQMSSYRRNFGGLVNFYVENEQVERIADEVYEFRLWYNDNTRVEIVDLIKNEKSRVSVCEALVLGRMEKLSAGSFGFDFSDAMDLDCGDFEDYVVDDDDDPDYEGFDYDESDNYGDRDSYDDMYYERSSGEGYIQ